MSVRIKFRVIKDTGAKRKFGVDLTEGQQFFLRRENDALKLGAHSGPHDIGFFEYSGGRATFKRARTNTGTVRVNGEELFERHLKRADLISFEGYTLEMLEVPGSTDANEKTSKSKYTAHGLELVTQSRVRGPEIAYVAEEARGRTNISNPSEATARTASTSQQVPEKAPTERTPIELEIEDHPRTKMSAAPTPQPTRVATLAMASSTRRPGTRPASSRSAQGSGWRAVGVTLGVAFALSAGVLAFREGPAAIQRGLKLAGRDPASLAASSSDAQLFFQAVSSGDLNEVTRILRRAPINVNLHFSGGKTALHEAAAHGHTELVRVLISVGANPEVRDQAGNTPLMSAVLQNQMSTFMELLRSGADPRAQRPDGLKLVDLAAQLQRAEFVQQLKSLESSPRDGQPGSSPASLPPLRKSN